MSAIARSNCGKATSTTSTTGTASGKRPELGRTTYSLGGRMPKQAVEVMPVHQKDRTDWLAAFIMLLVFAALMVALLSLGLGVPIPFIDT